jgi:signal transduction histidine kinase
MAGEIHDTLAQDLTVMMMELAAAQRATADPAAQRRHIDNAARLAKATSAEARRSVRALRPAALDAGDLPAALADVASHWSALHGVEVQVTATGASRELPQETDLALLRVAQEALANVAKHADASRVALTLSYMDDLVALDIRDNGKGFSPVASPNGGDPHHGYGLTSMQQRVERLAGQLDIETAPGDGTAISARIPAVVPKVLDG